MNIKIGGYMEYCPKCGGVQKHDPNCNLFEELLSKETKGKAGSDKKHEMLPVTTANLFCGFCNKVYSPRVTNCFHCHRPTNQITEAHLKSNLLLSGMGAAKVWDPPV